MKNNIHIFSQNEYVKKEGITEKIGIRGRLAMEFASLNLPILPGFIIDSDVTAHLENQDLIPFLKTSFKKIEQITGKNFGDLSNPLLVKIVISPNLAIVNYPTLHNFGLTDSTMQGFTKYVGEDFGSHEVLFLLKGYLEIEARILELEKKEGDAKDLRSKIKTLSEQIEKRTKASEFKDLLSSYRGLLHKDFFSDAYTQLEITLKRISYMLSLDELDDEDTALLIQPMVYGNYGKDSASGDFFTRNIVTGEKKL